MLSAQVPFSGVARGMWVNVCLPVAELTRALFKGAAFKCLDALTLTGTVRLRRIATLREAPPPAAYDIVS